MNDLQAVWKDLDQSTLRQPVNGALPPVRTSRHPVQKLIRAYQAGLVFVVIFGLGFGWLLIANEQLIVRIFLFLVVAVYAFFFVINYRVLRYIRSHFRLDGTIVDTLRLIDKTVEQSLAFQRRAALYVYPICAVAGALLGMSVEADVMELLARPWVAVIVAGILLLLTPPCYYLAVWLERLSYGKYRHQLQALIRSADEAV